MLAVGQHERPGASPLGFNAAHRNAVMDVDAMLDQPPADAMMKDFRKRKNRQHEVACTARVPKTVAENFLGGRQQSAIDRFAKLASMTSTTPQNRSMVFGDWF